MASFNKVILMGNLTRSPDLKKFPSGSVLCNLNLAINRKWFDKKSGQTQEEVTYVDVDAWGKVAENAAKYLARGSSCLVEGRLKLDQWEDGSTGEKRQKLKVQADTVTFTGSPKKKSEETPESSFPEDDGEVPF